VVRGFVVGWGWFVVVRRFMVGGGRFIVVVVELMFGQGDLVA
jgi:hypothetical protein